MIGLGVISIYIPGCLCVFTYVSVFSPPSPENELHEHSSAEALRLSSQRERAPARPKQTFFCTILNVAMRRLGTAWFKKHHKVFVDKKKGREERRGRNELKGQAPFVADKLPSTYGAMLTTAVVTWKPNRFFLRWRSFISRTILQIILYVYFTQHNFSAKSSLCAVNEWNITLRSFE